MSSGAGSNFGRRGFPLYFRWDRLLALLLRSWGGWTSAPFRARSSPFVARFRARGGGGSSNSFPDFSSGFSRILIAFRLHTLPYGLSLTCIYHVFFFKHINVFKAGSVEFHPFSCITFPLHLSVRFCLFFSSHSPVISFTFYFRLVCLSIPFLLCLRVYILFCIVCIFVHDKCTMTD